VNKDVLTQVELMVVHRTTAPQDKKALDEWIKDNAGEERRAEFMQSLARLKLGEAWFWSVGWLDTFSRVQVRMRETFDSSATPKPGERRVTPSTLADVNLDELREQLAATIEQAKANDPGELKRRVTQLERELARATKESPPAEPQIIRVPVITDGQMENLRTLFEDVKTYTDRLEACKWAFEKGMGKFIEDLDSYRRAAEARPASAHTSKPPPHTSGVKAQGAAPAGAGPRGDGAVTGPQQRMLDALRSFEVIGMDAVQKAHVAVFSGQSSKSSGFRANVSQLSSGGYVERLGDGLLRLTDAGRSQASDAYDQPLSLSALHAAWLEKLTTPQRTMLRLVIERHPEAIPKLDLAHRSGQSPLSSGYRANLSTLSSLGLVRRLPGGEVAATALLFPEGLR
jgi:hypothetical protein